MTFNIYNIPITGIAIKQLPMNSNIATTWHKVQGRTLKGLVINNSSSYRTANCVYVVLSRVKTLRGIVLNIKLDKTHKFTRDPQLLRWENKIKNIIERKTFEHRNQLDEYIKEELMYFPETL